MIFNSESLSETKEFALDFIAEISKSSREHATVIGLYGNLGSGKTTFVQYVAEILGVEGKITSPTFVIIKSYKLKVKDFKKLVHVDAYRLKGGGDLRKLGFEQLVQDPGNIIFIEWADLVSGILPADHIKLRFEFVDKKTRKISFVDDN